MDAIAILFTLNLLLILLFGVNTAQAASIYSGTIKSGDVTVNWLSLYTIAAPPPGDLFLLKLEIYLNILVFRILSNLILSRSHVSEISVTEGPITEINSLRLSDLLKTLRALSIRHRGSNAGCRSWSATSRTRGW